MDNNEQVDWQDYPVDKWNNIEQSNKVFKLTNMLF